MSDGWREHAACAGTWNRLPWVNPDGATPAVLTRMLDLCNTCPVLDDCRADLEERNDFTGVRGGVVWSANPRFLGHTRKVVRCAGCGLVMLADGRGQRFCSMRCRRDSKRGWRNTAGEDRETRRFPSGAGRNVHATLTTGTEKVLSRAPQRTVPALADNPDQRNLST